MSGVRLTGFWPKQAADQSWYLEGTLGQATVRIYENKYKKSDKDPSHVMYVNEKPKPQRSPQPQGQSQGGFQPRGPAVAPTKTYVDHTKTPQGDQTPPGQWDDEDVPF